MRGRVSSILRSVRSSTFAALVCAASVLMVVPSRLAAEVTEAAKLTASIASNFEFGSSVSVSGEYAIVGSPDDGSSGGAYILRRVDGAWTLVQKLKPPVSVSGVQFGFSVSITSNQFFSYAIVGAPGDNTNGIRSGAAYIFQLTDGAWTQLVKLTAPGGEAYDEFGTSVEINSLYAIVGAPGDDGVGLDAGAAYVFVGQVVSGITQWPLRDTLRASDALSGDRFGTSVSIDGYVAMVGGCGGTYIFARPYPSSTNFDWSQTQKLSVGCGDSVSIRGHNPDQYIAVAGIPSFHTILVSERYPALSRTTTITLNGNLGTSVGLHYLDSPTFPYVSSETRIVAGAPRLRLVQGEIGGLVVYSHTAAGSWSPSNIVSASDAAVGDRFGASVSIGTNGILAGAPGGNDRGVDSGSAYLLSRSTSGEWMEDSKHWPLDGDSSDQMGFSVSASGPTVIVGLPGDDDRALDGGSAYIYTGSGTTWTPLTKVSQPIAFVTTGDHFGSSIALADGVAIAGAPDDSSRGTASGSAWALTQIDETPPPSLFQHIAFDGTAGDRFGAAVGIRSNGVFVAGAPGDDDRGEDSGAVYTGDAGSDFLTKRVPSDGVPGDSFGSAVAISGNFAAVGAPGDDVSGSQSGSVYILDHLLDWAESSKLVPSDGASGDQFGSSVSMSGDFVIVGAPFDVTTFFFGNIYGSAYIYRRSGSTWVQEAKILIPPLEWLRRGSTSLDRFGASVLISDNGYAMVGAPGTDGGKGVVYVLQRTSGVWRFVDSLVASDGQAGDAFGTALALTGQTAFVGAPGHDDFRADLGAVYVFALPSMPWTGGSFDFNDGHTQGWTLAGAFDETGAGPFETNMTHGWSDSFNYPTWPGTDPQGDYAGAMRLFVPSPFFSYVRDPEPSTWWIMRFRSPDLSLSQSWQKARGYSIQLGSDVNSTASLYANLFVRVYDSDQDRDRFFFNGEEATQISPGGWNTFVFDWHLITTFPVRYVVREVFVNIWGLQAERLDPEDALYLDDVTIRYTDLDEDGFTNNVDCDDNDPSVHPGLAEICDGKDNNCDGAIPSAEGDPDGDASITCADNCPLNSNRDQRDSDGDSMGDVCDVCPADGSNLCDPSKSASGSIGSAGGSLVTPDGSVRLIVPAGALATETSISITGTGTGFELITNQGNGLAVLGIVILPDGLTFSAPVTLIFAWPDADNDGRVDSTTIRESSLVISKDGVAITGRCSQHTDPLQVPYCDVAANTFTIQTTSFSSLALFVFIEGAGAVPDGHRVDGIPLTAAPLEGGAIELSWGASCVPADTDYEIYEGTLGDFTSHIPKLCSTGGATRISITPASVSTYYLVVPRNAAREGSYGQGGDGAERSRSSAACLTQAQVSCQ